ncbi:MAG: DUF2585 family protein [Terriglobia bacterium]
MNNRVASTTQPPEEREQTMTKPSWKVCAVAVIAIMTFTAMVELWMGRLPFCKCGTIRLWAGDIWSNENSQQFADPYSFTHILHGVIFYALIWIVAGKRLPVRVRLVAAVMLEAGWEMLENSSFIIERYRAATVSLGYYGDSIFNSMGDICFMMTGFALACKLPVRVTVIGAVLVDLALLFWIRDSLALNIIMLIHPIAAIKAWQMVR